MNAMANAVRAPSYHSSLAALLRGHAHPLRDVEIRDLTQDSRAVTPGAAFLACQGRRTHGLAHAADAVERGAAAVLWEPVPAGVEVPTLPSHVVVCGVPELSKRLGDLADRFFREPSAVVRVAGITGTNGKTTTAFLLAQASELVGQRSSYLGTIGFGRAFELREAGLTTPDAISVHRRIAQARDDRAVTMAIEVSSHALDQERVNGVRFDTAVFTNLTRDHLDYHGTEQAYAAAKARLFEGASLKRAVVNVGDPFGRELASRLAPSVEQTLYTTSNELIADAAGWLRLSELKTGATGLTLQVESSWGAGTLRSKLIGEFNAENLLAALGVLLGWRVPLQQALVALGACVAPPGRMEAFGGGARPLVLVDYAHSPDALAKVLDAARAHARRQLLCVFGCGGDRDPGKRPQMGAIAEQLADVVFVTNDNPRSEDPLAIVAQIRAGMRDPARAHVVTDREAAIREALSLAEPGDVVVVAGKGHESYQLIGAEVRPFSDAQVVTDALGARP
jgi:UDP-N-acetylmuramoyl-L-alanyl-D-glutamate--2,6-diaminopimelate ligase